MRCSNSRVTLHVGVRTLKWPYQANALIEPDRGRFSKSGRIVANLDTTPVVGNLRVGSYTSTRRRCRVRPKDSICFRLSAYLSFGYFATRA
jgi:hypothetical protein